jgi:hypothetical protein
VLQNGFLHYIVRSRGIAVICAPAAAALEANQYGYKINTCNAETHFEVVINKSSFPMRMSCFLNVSAVETINVFSILGYLEYRSSYGRMFTYLKRITR